MTKSIFIFIVLIAACMTGCSSDKTTTGTHNRVGTPSGSNQLPAAEEYKPCGFINGGQVQCGEGEICGTVAWRPDEGARCYPEDICSRDQACGSQDCLILESWPAQIHCATTN